MKLQGKVAVITGGASGLGGATAEHFVRDKGARVAVFDINDAAGNAMVQRLGPENARYWNVDVADEDAVAAAVDSCAAHFGRIDVCVNCAGIPAVMKIIDRDGRVTEGKVFRRALMVNLAGTFHVMAHCAARMAANEPEDQERGVIINVASIAAFEGQIGHSGYSASKAGIVGMSLPAARELASRGIRVNSIAPGIFETPMAGLVRPDVLESLKRMVEFPKRPGRPEEFASMCAYICENAYLNGECIRIDAATRVRSR